MNLKGNFIRIAAAAFVALSLCHPGMAASRYWQAYNGTVDGDWSDKNHWVDGNLPASSDNVYIRLGIKGKISLDGAYSVNLFQVNSGGSRIALGGTGSLTEIGTTFEHILAGQSLEIADSAYYNASKAPQFTSAGTLKLSGGGMKTDSYNPGPLTDICGGSLTNSSATFGSGKVCNVSAGELRATGSYTFSSGSSLTVTGGRISAASGVTFNSGSTLTVEGCETDMGKATFNSGANINLGPNAILRLARTSSIVTTNITADATAKIVFYVPDGTAAARLTPIVMPRGTIDVEDLGVAIEIDAPEGWSGKMIGPCYFIGGGVVTTPSYTYEWTGEEDGYWSNPNNWKNKTVPTAGANVYISGEKNTLMTNDISGASFNCLHILASTAPVVIRGNPITLTTDTTSWSGDIALRSFSSNPVIFEVKVTFSNRYGYSDARSGYISHRGGIAHTSKNSSRFVQYNGDILYGGTASFRRMQARTTSGCTLTYLADANYTLTEQHENLAKGGALTIFPGGLLTVGSYCQVNNSSSKINGTLNLAGTLTGNQSMGGSGVVKTSGTFSTAVGTNTFTLAGSLTLQPASWNTQPGASTIFRIKANSGTPRLSAATDWTYGPASGEPDATRALTIASGATLTVDTQDPSTGAGHTITFTDPIVAEGSLVKDGAGTLMLPEGPLSIGGSFRMGGGKVGVRGAIDVSGAFSAAPGTTFDVEELAIGDEFATVLTAASVDGVPALGEKYTVRVLTDADTGRVSIRARLKQGAIIMFK